jgi:hypothetical protein
MLKRKKTKAAKIRSFIAANPNATARYVADQLNVPIQSVYNVKHKLRAAEKPAENIQKFMGVTMATEDIPKLTDEQALRLAENLNKPKMRMLSVSTSNKSIKPLIMDTHHQPTQSTTLPTTPMVASRQSTTSRRRAWAITLATR